MVAPAVLAAAAKAAKTAKVAKQMAALAGGQGGGKGGKKKHRLLLLLGGGGVLTLGGILLVVMLLLVSMLGGMGAGVASASCEDYADDAEAGNTDPAAATNPIMPGAGMYAPSETARHEIPPRMLLAAMRAAARHDGLDWTLIAGQMYQETKFGQDKSAAPGGDNGYGYSGILQFGDAAWQDYGADGNGDGRKDRYNVDDAAFAAADFLHAEKAERQAWEALRRYSGSTRTNTIYMRVVLAQASRYRGAFTQDEKRIKRWYGHLADTVKKNPGFPKLGAQADIPEPVGNDVRIEDASSIPAATAKDWSTPPLPGDGGGSEENSPSTEPVAYSRPLDKPGENDAGEMSGEEWQWPIKKGGYQSGTPYRKRGSMWSLGYHTGLDLVAPTGTPLHAPAAGTVTEAGVAGSYGRRTTIRHEGGVLSLYAHQNSLSVSVGDKVERGDRIGTVGATGNVTGPHLHWEVRVPGVDNPFVAGQDEGPGMVDPAGWMEGRVTADPDYGGVPGGDGEGRDADYAQCAGQSDGPRLDPDGAGATGVLPSSDDPVIRAVLLWAQRGLGVPYVLGAPRLQGRNPDSFDCSSYVQWAYHMASDGKIRLPATTYTQEPHLKKYEVPLEDAQPGDLIFFEPGSRGPEHVAMVWDPANKKIIHAPRPGKTVEFSTWDVQKKITGVYRVPIPKGTSPVETDGKDGGEHA